MAESIQQGKSEAEKLLSNIVAALEVRNGLSDALIVTGKCLSWHTDVNVKDRHNMLYIISAIAVILLLFATLIIFEDE